MLVNMNFLSVFVSKHAKYARFVIGGTVLPEKHGFIRHLLPLNTLACVK